MIPYCKVFLGTTTYQKIRENITRDYDVQHFKRSIYTMRTASKRITSLCFDTVSWDRLTESCEKVQPAKWKCRSRYSSARSERWVRFTTVACAKRYESCQQNRGFFLHTKPTCSSTNPKWRKGCSVHIKIELHCTPVFSVGRARNHGRAFRAGNNSHAFHENLIADERDNTRSALCRWNVHVVTVSDRPAPRRSAKVAFQRLRLRPIFSR